MITVHCFFVKPAAYLVILIIILLVIPPIGCSAATLTRSKTLTNSHRSASLSLSPTSSETITRSPTLSESRTRSVSSDSLSMASGTPSMGSGTPSHTASSSRSKTTSSTPSPSPEESLTTSQSIENRTASSSISSSLSSSAVPSSSISEANNSTSSSDSVSLSMSHNRSASRTTSREQSSSLRSQTMSSAASRTRSLSGTSSRSPPTSSATHSLSGEGRSRSESHSGTFSSTRTSTAPRSQSDSASASLAASRTESKSSRNRTHSASLSFQQSRTESTSISVSTSRTTSFSTNVSLSRSKATPSTSLSSTASPSVLRSESVSDSYNISFTMESISITETISLSLSPNTPSLSSSPLETKMPTPTDSELITLTMTLHLTDSAGSLSTSDSFSVVPSMSLSWNGTESQNVTRASLSHSLSQQLSGSETLSRSSSRSASDSFSSSPTDEWTDSESITSSDSLSSSLSLSPSATITPPPTPSTSSSLSEELTTTETHSLPYSNSSSDSVSATITRTDSLSDSYSRSLSFSRSATQSDSSEVSVSSSLSSTASITDVFSSSASLSQTPTSTDTLFLSPSHTFSFSSWQTTTETVYGTYSYGDTRTETPTGSSTTSLSSTRSVSVSPSTSASDPSSSSATLTNDLSPSFSDSADGLTASMSPSFSSTATISDTLSISIDPCNTTFRHTASLFVKQVDLVTPRGVGSVPNDVQSKNIVLQLSRVEFATAREVEAVITFNTLLRNFYYETDRRWFFDPVVTNCAGSARVINASQIFVQFRYVPSVVSTISVHQDYTCNMTFSTDVFQCQRLTNFSFNFSIGIFIPSSQPLIPYGVQQVLGTVSSVAATILGTAAMFSQSRAATLLSFSQCQFSLLDEIVFPDSLVPVPSGDPVNGPCRGAVIWNTSVLGILTLVGLIVGFVLWLRASFKGLYVEDMFRKHPPQKGHEERSARRKQQRLISMKKRGVLKQPAAERPKVGASLSTSTPGGEALQKSSTNEAETPSTTLRSLFDHNDDDDDPFSVNLPPAAALPHSRSSSLTGSSSSLNSVGLLPPLPPLPPPPPSGPKVGGPFSLLLFLECLGKFHFPSILVIPCALCFDGTGSCSVSLLVHAIDSTDTALGVFGLLWCVAVLILIIIGVWRLNRYMRVRRVLKQTRHAALAQAPPMTWRARVRRTMFPRGHWGSLQVDEEDGKDRGNDATPSSQTQNSAANRSWNLVVKRNALFLIDGNRWRFYVILELLTSLIVSLCYGVGISDRTWCLGLAVGCTAVVVALCVAVVLIRPFFTNFSTLFVLLANSLSAAAGMLTVISMLFGWETATSMQEVVASAVMCLGFFKLFIDVWICYLTFRSEKTRDESKKVDPDQNEVHEGHPEDGGEQARALSDSGSSTCSMESEEAWSDVDIDRITYSSTNRLIEEPLNGDNPVSLDDLLVDVDRHRGGEDDGEEMRSLANPLHDDHEDFHVAFPPLTSNRSDTTTHRSGVDEDDDEHRVHDVTTADALHRRDQSALPYERYLNTRHSLIHATEGGRTRGSTIRVLGLQRRTDQAAVTETAADVPPRSSPPSGDTTNLNDII